MMDSEVKLRKQAAVDRDEILQAYVADYEYLGETEDGRDACYQPNERERLLIEDAIRGWESYLETDLAPPTRDAVGELLEAAKDARFALYGTGAGNPRLDAAIAALTGDPR